MKKYWLLKCEPSAYSIDDLQRDGKCGWEGVRNYQARNLLRDEIKPGDAVLFYASNADPSGVSGLARVSRSGFPDPFQFDKKHKYFDPESNPSDPRWYSVEIEFVAKFRGIVPLETLKQTPGLENMMVTKKGSRLSVQPVTKDEYEIVAKLGKKK